MDKPPPAFTLWPDDATAPRAICFWIMENINTCPAEKLREALDIAIRMRESMKREFLGS